MKNGKLKNLLFALQKLKNLLFARTELTILILDKNFTPHNPEPVTLKGFVVDEDVRKVLDVGSSQGVTFKGKWLSLTSTNGRVKQQLLIDKERNDHYILLTKPKEGEVPA